VSDYQQRQSDIAFERLKQLIVHVDLAPGSLIDESELMERLGVGRTPLREALQRLAQEDLIDVIPRRGAFVAEVSVTDLTHVFEMRRYLEGLAARLAAKRAEPEHIVALNLFLEEACAGADSEDLHWNLETDRCFHQIIVEAAANPYLQQTLDRLYNLAIRLMYVSNTRMTLVQEELPKYQAVIEAIKKGDGEAADEAMRAHLWLTPFAMIAALDSSRRGSASEPTTKPSDG